MGDRGFRTHLGRTETVLDPNPPKEVIIPHELQNRITDMNNTLTDAEKYKNSPNQFFQNFYEQLHATHPNEKPVKIIVDGDAFIILPSRYGNGLYAVLEAHTKIPISSGFKSVKEAISEIQTPNTETYNYIHSKAKAANPHAELTEITRNLTEDIVDIKSSGGKSYRGEIRRGEIVVEIGAGDHPDARTTDVIDIGTDLAKFPGIRYHMGINADQHPLPYPSGSVDRVVSYGAWGYNFGSDHLAQETHRILKSNGIVHIGLPYGAVIENPSLSRSLKRTLFNVGLRIIGEKHRKYSGGEDRWEIIAKKR
jgi:SAM-dependent methyltransferase